MRRRRRRRGRGGDVEVFSPLIFQYDGQETDENGGSGITLVVELTFSIFSIFSLAAFLWASALIILIYNIALKVCYRLAAYPKIIMKPRKF